MPEKTDYAPGEPTWIDVATPDMAATASFYGALLGWELVEGRAEFGGYANFTKNGKKVAGALPLTDPDQPPAWTTYVRTADAAKTDELVQSAGGTVVAPPMDVGELGRMALYVDPAGAFFGTWQAGTHTGAELVQEEGTWQWAELGTKDVATARPFYEGVFGWSPLESDGYTEWQQDGRSVAGCMPLPDEVPMSFWQPYFATSDLDGSARRVEELGGRVIVPPTEFPGGRFSVVADVHGTTFGLLAMPT